MEREPRAGSCMFELRVLSTWGIDHFFHRHLEFLALNLRELNDRTPLIPHTFVFTDPFSGHAPSSPACGRRQAQDALSLEVRLGRKVSIMLLPR